MMRFVGLALILVISAAFLLAGGPSAANQSTPVLRTYTVYGDVRDARAKTGWTCS